MAATDFIVAIELILQDHRYCRKETCGRKHTSAGPRQRKLFGFYP